MHVTLLDPSAQAWPGTIENLYERLGGASNPTLLPVHFLQTALHRIGGHVALVSRSAATEIPQAVLFLFPRFGEPLQAEQTRAYTVRLHLLGTSIDWATLQAQLRQRLPGANFHLYDPTAPQEYQSTHQLYGRVDIGRPDEQEAQAIRQLQQQVWGSPSTALYPTDIHSREFDLATSLIARVDGQPVGFLFGFHKFGGCPLPADWQTRFGGDWRVESQTLGVLPTARGGRIGFLLKKVQALDALGQGRQLINWTVDPLQWPNALLNLGLLRAVAFDFTPDYYPFRNELNRVAASRFSLSWLIDTPRVQTALATGIKHCLDLRQWPAIVRLNAGDQPLVQATAAPQIAVEIPANWTALQHADLATALRWRATTDALFQRYVGWQPGRYVITDVGVDGARCYLIGQRAGDEQWAKLAAAANAPG
jgi:predicted GNAT superfamily acetyltransferase